MEVLRFLVKVKTSLLWALVPVMNQLRALIRLVTKPGIKGQDFL